MYTPRVGDKVSYPLGNRETTGYVLREKSDAPGFWEVSDTYSTSGQVYVLQASEMTKVEDYEVRFKK